MKYPQQRIGWLLRGLFHLASTLSVNDSSSKGWYSLKNLTRDRCDQAVKVVETLGQSDLNSGILVQNEQSLRFSGQSSGNLRKSCIRSLDIYRELSKFVFKA